MWIAMFVELIPSFLSATCGYQDITLCFAFDEFAKQKNIFPPIVVASWGKKKKNAKLNRFLPIFMLGSSCFYYFPG